MPISSLIVKTVPSKIRDVADKLNTLAGATVSDIHAENIVVITETKKQGDDQELWETIEGIPGVLKCDLIYHNFEDEEGFKYE